MPESLALDGQDNRLARESESSDVQEKAVTVATYLVLHKAALRCGSSELSSKYPVRQGS